MLGSPACGRKYDSAVGRLACLFGHSSAAKRAPTNLSDSSDDGWGMSVFGNARLGWRDIGAQGAVLAISAVVVAVWAFTKPIVFTYDTFTYINQARELYLGQSSEFLFTRLPIFPAALLTFHVTELTDSVFWLIIFQSCLAVASCWLFYLTARRIEPRGAFTLSLIFIASLLPFMNVKYIMTEQMFFFETMLTLYGLVSYLVARTNREALPAIVILGVGTALMTLTRPQGAYVVPAIFGIVALLAWRRAWFALIAAVLVVGVVWSVQVADQKARRGSQISVGRLDSSNMTGAMLFFTFYLDGSKENIRFSPENGPETTYLKALLLDEFAKPDTLARRSGYLTVVPPEEVQAYVERSFREPNSEFWALLSFTALKERLGAKEADRLLVRVCLEAMRAYPLRTAQVLIGKMFETYFEPHQLVVPINPQFETGTFRGHLAEEIAAAGDYTIATAFDLAIDRNLRWLMQISIIVAIITLPIALRYPSWRITIALFGFGLYLNFAVAIGNLPLFRYAIYAIPATLLCGYVGAVALASVVRDRYLKKSVIQL